MTTTTEPFLVIFRLCRSDIFATQKRYCRFAAAILYSPPKLGEAQYHLQSKYNWRSQYNSPKANIAEKDSDCITIRVFFWQGHDWQMPPAHGAESPANGLSHGLKTCPRHDFLTAFQVLVQQKSPRCISSEDFFGRGSRT